MIDKIIKKNNIALAVIIAMLIVSVYMIAGTKTAQAWSPLAAPPGSPASAKMSYRNLRGLPDDKCYSTPAVLSDYMHMFDPSSIANGGRAGFGLVNAIVRLPIYDWDQDVIRQSDKRGQTPTGASRPVAYAHKFTFNTTPIPNLTWMRNAAASGSFLSISGPDANPLLYMQASMLDAQGNPVVPLINNSVHPPSNPPGAVRPVDTDNSSNNEDATDQAENINDASQYPDKMKDLVNNLNQQNGGRDIFGNMRKNGDFSNVNTFSAAIARMARDGILRPFTTTLSVDGNKVEDTCYETAEGRNDKRVPAYAFSVMTPGLPISIPGVLYSIPSIMLGKGPSFDGVTFYPPSLNGKMMIDCYGRGTTNTMRFGPETIAKGTPLHGDYAWAAGHALVLFSLLNERDKQKAFWWLFVGLPTDLAAAAHGAPNPLAHTPMPFRSDINYYNGLKNLYSVNSDSIELPGDVPGLAGREIDWNKSQLVWQDGLTDGTLLGPRNKNDPHASSTNGTVQFPHLYIKLKKPYNYQPKFSETEPSKTTPDGSDFTVIPEIDKYGYKKDPYDTGPTVPRTNRDPAPKGWAKARIIETVVKPGFSGNPPREREYLGKHLPGDGADLDAEAICDFIKTEIGNSPDSDAVESCNQHGGDVPLDETTSEDFIKNEVNKVTLTDYAVSRKIPAETPPGTKFCYSIYINQKDNDLKYKRTDYYKHGVPGYNDEYEAERDKRYLSKMYCVISGYKPSFQVRGGDMIVQGDVNTATNLKDDLGSGDPPTEKRTFGSWAEYGLFAGGSIDGGRTGSGAKYRVGQGNPASVFDPHGYLTFSNAYTSGNTPNYGTFSDELSDGFDRVTGFFNERSENAKSRDTTCIKPGNKIKLSDCASGDYVIDGDVEIEGGDIENRKNKSLVFFVEDKIKVSIKGDIKMPNNYDSSSKISQVVFTPKNAGDKYLIDIHQNVTRVDAWLLNPDGAINTCYNPKPVGADGNELGTTADDIPRAKDGQQPNVCYTNRLTVNGPVNAKHLILRRSGGVDQNQKPPYSPTHQSVPGEAFNLRPDAYLWAVNQVSSGGSKFMTVQTKDLPPRY